MIFSDLFKAYSGYPFKSNKYTPDGNYKVITIKNIKNNGFTTESADKILYEDIYNNYILNEADILLTMTGDVGRVGIVSENNCLLNQRVLKVKGESNSYTYTYLKCNYNIINSIAKGSVQLNLGLNDLNQLEVKHSLNSILKFKNNDILFEQMVRLKKENIKLIELKQNYLLKFFQ